MGVEPRTNNPTL